MRLTKHKDIVKEYTKALKLAKEALEYKNIKHLSYLAEKYSALDVLLNSSKISVTDEHEKLLSGIKLDINLETKRFNQSITNLSLLNDKLECHRNNAIQDIRKQFEDLRTMINRRLAQGASLIVGIMLLYSLVT